MIIASLFAKTQKKVFFLDLVGCVIVAAHFWFLDALGGMFLSLLYAVKDIVGLISHRTVKLLIALLIGILMILSPVFVSFDYIDSLALIGSIIALISRISGSLTVTFFLIALSTLFWGIYGVLVDSVGQVLFSILYAAIAITRGFQTKNSTRQENFQ